MPITWPGNWLAIFRHCDGGKKKLGALNPLSMPFLGRCSAQHCPCATMASRHEFMKESQNDLLFIWVWYGSTPGVDDRELHIQTYQIGGLEHVLFFHILGPIIPTD